jgi:hypothetical protein
MVFWSSLMPAKKRASTPANTGFKRAQDKILGWSLIALVGFIVWLYLQDRSEWRAFMQEQRNINSDVSRRLELSVERHGRMREDITAQNERIARQWEMISEVRDGFRDGKK